ncbi:MAG: hypothetical protein COA79_11390 [Planctomycetota bacterium]|nr:MAG: hypothetical protein COA79_11390 [Planctomycetota bacterium]
MKPRIVIIGTGLGGCYLASGLLDYFEVVMIEMLEAKPLLRDRIKDVALPAVTYPHVESGYGGTTKAWHNALMEIDESVFADKWPFLKNTMVPFYDLAYSALSGTTRQKINQFAQNLRNKLEIMGFSKSLLNQNMFIPKNRINAWKKLDLKNKVKTIEGEVTELIHDGVGRIDKIKICRKNDDDVLVDGDYFVLSSGGLGSPILLQKLFKSLPIDSLKNAGCHYEDHPIAFVGEVQLNKPLYKLWDFPVKTSSGNANIRLPFSFFWEGINVSFQLRPAHHFRLSKPREKVVSIISELRNFPFNPLNYLKLLKHVDDIFEILSFKFGLRIPTRNYTILMVAEQPPAPYCAVWKEEGDNNIYRRWELDDVYVKVLNNALTKFLDTISPVIKKYNLFSNWPTQVYSSSHHSGTARISKDEKNGVCDENGQVYGLSNLFICDGSMIPSSGFVNTGLTIVALAIRMAKFLSLQVKSSKIKG